MKINVDEWNLLSCSSSSPLLKYVNIVQNNYLFILQSSPRPLLYKINAKKLF